MRHLHCRVLRAVGRHQMPAVPCWLLHLLLPHRMHSVPRRLLHGQPIVLHWVPCRLHQRKPHHSLLNMCRGQVLSWLKHLSDMPQRILHDCFFARHLPDLPIELLCDVSRHSNPVLSLPVWLPVHWSCHQLLPVPNLILLDAGRHHLRRLCSRFHHQCCPNILHGLPSQLLPDRCDPMLRLPCRLRQCWQSPFVHPVPSYLLLRFRCRHLPVVRCRQLHQLCSHHVHGVPGWVLHDLGHVMCGMPIRLWQRCQCDCVHRVRG
jgi:hypothetical protein